MPVIVLKRMNTYLYISEKQGIINFYISFTLFYAGNSVWFM